MPKLPFGFEQPEDSPGFLLWQTTMVWQRLIKKALDDFDVSHCQFVIMASLLWFNEQAQDMTQVSLINWTKLDKMTVSKSLKKLVDMRLVLRTESEVDSRAKCVSLTKQGKALIRKLVPIVENVDSLFFKSISNQQQKSLIDSFKKLSESHDR